MWNAWSKKNKYHMIYVFKNEECCLGLCHLVIISPKKLIKCGCRITGQHCISPTIELGPWKAIKMK